MKKLPDTSSVFAHVDQPYYFAHQFVDENGDLIPVNELMKDISILNKNLEILQAQIKKLTESLTS